MTRLTATPPGFEYVVLITLFLVFTFFSTVPRAQLAASASIQGRVSDETGAALPGVVLTLTSPALQVPQLTTTTDADGTYHFRDLPYGMYRIAYDLSGFQPTAREDLRLTVGFVAKVDVILRVGNVRETVTVSAPTPVIDASTTVSSTTFTTEVLQAVPRGRSLFDTLAMAPGISVAAAPDVGDSNMGHRSNITNYGGSGQPKLEVEGINTQTLSDRDAAYYMDFANFDEVQVKSSGNDAEMAGAGVDFLGVVKSGGNNFHGLYHSAYQGPKLQSNNVDASLISQGVQNSTPLLHYYDAAGDLGGRLVRDKLWFYGAIVRQELETQLLGFVKSPGPDGNYFSPLAIPGNTLTRLDNQTLKMSYQPAPKYKFIGLYQRGVKYLPDGAQDGNRFHPYEATTDYTFRSTVWKGEFQGTPSDSLLIDVVGGYYGYVADYLAQASANVPGNPSREDLTTGLFTGPTTSASKRPVWRYQSEGSVSYFAQSGRTGKHDLKAGYQTYFEGTGTGYLDKVSGNYLLIFKSGKPYEIQTFNYPVDPVSNLRSVGTYVKDNWTVTPRLTVNVGVRWDRYHSFLPSQTKTQGTFGASGTFPALDVLTWNRLVPRAGIAWDLRGDGKTVVKGTYGLFNYSMGPDFASTYNQNALTTTTYLWRDLNLNGNYDPGEVNLDTSGGDFQTISGASNSIRNPDLKQPITAEYTAGIERELAPGVAVRGIYVYQHEHDLYRSINVRRPLSAYTIPVQRQDPGPDGVVGTPDDGPLVTLYDYSPAYKGSAYVGNEQENSPNDNWYHSLEVTVTKRASHRWAAIASFGETRNHRWLASPPSTSSDLFYPLDATWGWHARVTSTLQLPHNIQLGALWQSQAGIPGQRTFIFTGLPQSATMTVRLDPFGTERGPVNNVVNLRVVKEFRLTQSRRFAIEINCYNVLNSNAATATSSGPNPGSPAINYASGPTYGYVTAILPPRIVRFGAKFSF